MKKISSDSDLELVEKIVQKDEVAFEHLVDIYKLSVLNTIYRYTGNSAYAEDISQEVFCKVWLNIKKFRAKSKFSTWLYRIVVNECLNHQGRLKKRMFLFRKIENKFFLKPEGKEVNYEEAEQKEVIRKLIKALPERQRMALILCQYEDRSYAEISQIMNISVPAVESLLFRARETIKKQLIYPKKEKEKI